MGDLSRRGFLGWIAGAIAAMFGARAARSAPPVDLSLVYPMDEWTDEDTEWALRALEEPEPASATDFERLVELMVCDCGYVIQLGSRLRTGAQAPVNAQLHIDCPSCGLHHVVNRGT